MRLIALSAPPRSDAAWASYGVHVFAVRGVFEDRLHVWEVYDDLLQQQARQKQIATRRASMRLIQGGLGEEERAAG